MGGPPLPPPPTPPPSPRHVSFSQFPHLRREGCSVVWNVNCMTFFHMLHAKFQQILGPCHAHGYRLLQHTLTYFSGVANDATKHVAKLVAKQKKPSKPRKRTLVAISRRPVPVPLVNHHLQSQVKELLSAYPGGLVPNVFCSAFRRRFGEELDFRRVGFRTIQELLHVIPSVNVTVMPSGESRIFGPGMKCRNGEFFSFTILPNILCNIMFFDIPLFVHIH